jgi:uncharacterized protein YoxC
MTDLERGTVAACLIAVAFLIIRIFFLLIGLL